MKKEEVKDVEVVEKKDETTKKILRKAWNIFFWVCFACILFTWIYDFVQTKNEKDPAFCVAKNTLQVDSGTVDECVGLGYKVFKYNTDNENKGAREFGAFWISPRD